ncbi:hypothetical protein Glove_166g13 [Diversispora epigaea]|uniref:Protein kinase domain-containing protein n=1 Tax=Diversispora epigaea TaxID=1348612 RepID=A0A397IQP0_9GLOM|nr:hypothetical protein Glove_166g13 [Diversispora epigaea]
MRGEYTQASDVYSFGMIMLEILTSYPPYYNTPHDINLIMSICKGQKPEIKYEIPRLLRDLMERCWDSDPHNRPTAKELETELNEYYFKGNNELTKQFGEVYASNKDFIPYDPSEAHPQAIYKSRSLLSDEDRSFYFDNTSNSRQIFMVLPNFEIVELIKPETRDIGEANDVNDDENNEDNENEIHAIFLETLD